MPFLQRATNNYFGFAPAYGNQRTNIYLVSSSATTGANAIYPGDVVLYSTLAEGANVVRVVTGATTDVGVMVGVAASYVPALGGSTAAPFNQHTSQNVLIYDDPSTIFVGCDTTSGVIGTSTGAIGIGKQYGVASTGVIGSTGPNWSILRSVQALSGVTASSGSGRGYRFKVLGLHPVEKAYSTELSGAAAAGAQVRKWLMRAAQHAPGLETAGNITT